MENRKKKLNNNNSQTRCKKHPKHQQSPGVCSICLRERLSQISTPTSSSSRKAMESYCSSSSSYLSSLSSSSHCSSSELSPARYRVRSGSGLKWSKNNVFGKSRSMAFVGELQGEGKKKKKKSTGFWSKLLRPRSHDTKSTHMDGVFMRERMFSTRVH